MILVDTTVWIDFFKGRNTAQVSFLEEAISHKKEIFICGVILTEILQGIKQKKQQQLVSSVLDDFSYINMTKSTYILAADIYKQLRAKGVTVRKTIDCMIAAVALENDLLLLQNDKDFLPIASHLGLKLI